MSVRLPSFSMKQGAISALHGLLIDKAAAHILLRKACQIFASDEAHMAFGGVLADEVARVLALDGAGGGENRDEAGARALGGGLDGGHRADEGHGGKGGAQFGHDDGGGGVAGDDAEDRVVRGDQPRKQLNDMRLQLLLVPFSIRKPRIIGNIDEPAVRHENARLAQNGEAADAAVEEEYGFGHERSQVSSE